MKNLLFLVVLLTSLDSTFGQARLLPDWHATITVLNESNQPIPDAKVSAIFWTPVSQTKQVSTNISGISDSSGVFHASHVYTGFPAMLFRVEKEGFYRTTHAYDLGDYYNAQIWNPSIDLVLKKMEHPTPMYAKLVDLVIPAFEKPVGYDLMAGDWVAPYGKGISSDIIFISHYYNKHAKEDFDHQLIVSFPNVGDGVQPMESPLEQAGSELRSPHKAPFSGYESRTIRATSEHPGKTLFSDYDSNRAYFFRVRTVLDEKGKVKSALYGKIYGDFNFFRYYLNPTPNDRNIEFDPKQNLLVGQNVTAP